VIADRSADGRADDPRRVPVILSSSSVYPESTERTFALAADLGYDGVEIMVTADAQTQRADHLLPLAERYDIPVMAVHSPCLVVSSLVWSRDPLVKLDRTIQLAESLGARTVVVHPPFVWQRAAAASFEVALRLLQESTTVRIAVENEYPQRRAGQQFSLYRPHWDPTMFDCPWYTLDLSHCAASGSDAMEVARRMGNRLVHVHLADGAVKGSDQHLVPGAGNQPWKDVLRLIRRRPSAIVTVEVTTVRSTSAARADALSRSLRLARDCLAGG
jgi:sugar phosphate isomerase/epimerase